MGEAEGVVGSGMPRGARESRSDGLPPPRRLGSPAGGHEPARPLRRRTGSLAVRHRLIHDHDDLVAALPDIDAEVVGLDVERSTKPRYDNPAALVQVGTAEVVLLIDTHELGGHVPILGDFLAERIVVLHAGTNDIPSLDEADVDLDTFEDTAVAAAVLGLPLGLDNLLQELLGVALSPDKDRFQRADWERRPLPDDMAAYAAGDVEHLPALIMDLRERLADLGRLDWYRQERDHMIDSTRASTRAWEDTRGSGRLGDAQRSVLRALWIRREHLAKRDDLAPQRVLRDETLVDLAGSPAVDVDDLSRRNKRRNQPTRGHAVELLEAQGEGLAAQPQARTGASRRFDRADRDRHAAMRNARSAVADEMGLDAGFLCPGRTLWAPIAAEPADVDELVAHLDLRPWQCDLLADMLWEAYTSVE